MNNLNIKSTIVPAEKFESKEEWMKALGLKPIYREDGTSIAKDVELDEWISMRRLAKGIQNFTEKTWSEFVSHRKLILENFYKSKNK